MNKKINQLFVNEVNKLIESGKTKTEIAKSIGYNGIHALDKVLNDKIVTVVQFDKLVNFCQVYGYDLDFFLKNETYTENKMQVLEIRQPYNEKANLKQVSEIDKRISAIEKANELMKNLFLSGVQFSDMQVTDLKDLRLLVGV